MLIIQFHVIIIVVRHDGYKRTQLETCYKAVCLAWICSADVSDASQSLERVYRGHRRAELVCPFLSLPHGK